MLMRKIGKGESGHSAGSGWGVSVVSERVSGEGLVGKVIFEQRPGGEEVNHVDV